MSDQVWLAAIAIIPPTMAALAALRSSRQTARKIETVHVQVNHRMDQLLARTSEVAGLEATATEKARAAGARGKGGSP